MKGTWLPLSIALGLLALTGIAVYLPDRVREIPLSSSLHAIPRHLAGWIASGDDPPPDLPAVDPAARTQVTRAFQHDGEVVWVTVFYYPLESEESRGRGRDLVFPSRGFTDLTEGVVEIPRADGGPLFSAYLVSVRVRQESLTILYWYQVRGGSLTSEHWYRATLLYNRLVHHRADGALVRLVWRGTKDFGADVALRPQTEFVQAIHRELGQVLPR